MIGGMAVVLAVLTALSYGVGDFSGGLASRRANALTVTASAHAVGFVGVLMVAAIVGATDVRTIDLFYGAAAGVCGCVGVVLLYRGMASGAMAIVSPVSAVIAAAVPVAAGLVAGERPGGAGLAGIVAAIVAIVLVSHSGPMGRPSASTLLVAAGSGFGFGMFFLFISGVQEGAGLWPLVLGRLVSCTLASAIAISRGLPVVVPRAAIGLTIAAGVLDVGANVTFLLATQHGMLAVVAVIASLYPAGTVLLAMWIEDERLSPVQTWGLAAAGAALVLIAL
jgi:uncharacterized membrane protein